MMTIDKTTSALYAQAKRGAARRGIGWELPVADFDRLCKEAGGKCQVTGITFSGAREGASNKRPYKPSLDRIDSTRPYSYNNCRLVCVCVNLAMGDWGEGVLRRMAMFIAGKQIESLADQVAKRVISEVVPEVSRAASVKEVKQPAESAKEADDNPKKLIPQRQVREMFGGVSNMTLWRWNKSGFLPDPIVINRRNYYNPADIASMQTQANGAEL